MSSTLPIAKLKSAAAGPQAFKRMIGSVDSAAKAGDLVMVQDKNGSPYGIAIYNPKSLITLRLLTRDTANFDPDEFFGGRLKKAIELRRDVLGLDARTNAYRVVHDQGDGLPGLVIDKYGDCVVLEFYSLGMYKQAGRLEKLLAECYPGAKFFRRASSYTETMEGFNIPETTDSYKTRVVENGVMFEVDLQGGYKTGFFVDQRENRLALTQFTQGKTVIDICGYTGGFGLYAAKIGGATEVTSVELDPDASAQAKKNANVNGVGKIFNTVCVDAFPYLRQAIENKQQYDVVVLDPYKLIASREKYEFGRQKYGDFNRLALQVVKPGGLFVTNSCSGLLHWEEFWNVLRKAAGSTGRRVQVFRKSGAGPDHPVSTDYPEGEYLKVIWARVL
jgi:23S rRNA (cytosine1962-C5)-methyltransferase